MPAKPSAMIDTRVIYYGDKLDRLRKPHRESLRDSASSKQTGGFYYHCDSHASILLTQ